MADKSGKNIIDAFSSEGSQIIQNATDDQESEDIVENKPEPVQIENKEPKFEKFVVEKEQYFEYKQEEKPKHSLSTVREEATSSQKESLRTTPVLTPVLTPSQIEFHRESDEIMRDSNQGFSQAVQENED